MPENLYIPKQLDEIDRLPEGSLIGLNWLHLVFDPVARKAYAATSTQISLAVAPQLLFGTDDPPQVTSAMWGSTYTKDLQNGTIEIYQLFSAGWMLMVTFGGNGVVAPPSEFTATKGYTASCAAGFSGSSVYREATRRSTVSQADADALALAAATSLAMSSLVCTPVANVFTSTKSITLSCQAGFTGPSVTRTATITSVISQADADNKATAEARRLATADLVCTVILTTPAAPIFLSYNVSARTATVAGPSGFSNSQLDYRVNGGSAISVPSNGVINVGAANVPIDGLVVYVRASNTNLQGLPASNSTAFLQSATSTTFTSTRSYTASCGAGTTGPSVTRTATRSSVISQADADQLALDAATQNAILALVCTPARGVSTPDAPAVAFDDVNNTLSFASPLGQNEIVFSENNGPFLPYTGQIQVGDVVRAQGYWRAKIKAATNRNESGITQSPAFTATQTPNQNPTVTLSLGTTGTLASGGTQTATASPLDSDGTITSVSLTDNGNLVATRMAPPYTFSWQPTGAGNHVVTVTATDNQGGTGSSTLGFTLAAAPVIYTTTLNGPSDAADVVTLSSLSGVKVEFNAPLPDGDPGPFTTYLFVGTEEIGQLDAAPGAAGQLFRLTYNGQSYTKSFTNGNLNLSA